MPSKGPVDFIDRSDKVFTSPRLVRFVEMEYAIPRAALTEALNRVRALVDDGGRYIGFPVEVRFTQGDDIPLSTAEGRDTCYIAVHVYKGTPYHEYFSGVERIMDDYGGRPHWGKLHFQTADDAGAPLPPLGRVPGGASQARPRRRVHERLRPPRPRPPTVRALSGRGRPNQVSDQGPGVAATGVVVGEGAACRRPRRPDRAPPARSSSSSSRFIDAGSPRSASRARSSSRSAGIGSPAKSHMTVRSLNSVWKLSPLSMP